MSKKHLRYDPNESLGSKIVLLVALVAELWWLRTRAWLASRPKRQEVTQQFSEKRSEFRMSFPKLDPWLSLILAAIYVVIALVIWQLGLLLFQGPPPVPNQGPTIPTVAPAPTMDTRKPLLEQFQYYGARESEQLRQQPNVVNVAVLGGGYGARYMVEYAVVLDNTWKQVKFVNGITGFNPGKSSFMVRVDVNNYTLNHHQGFLLAERPDRIYLMDSENRIWEAVFSQDMLVPVAEAVSKLPAPIPANPQLTLTLK